MLLCQQLYSIVSSGHFITLQISLSKSPFLLDVVVVVVVAVGEEDEGVKIKTKLSLLYRLTCF